MPNTQIMISHISHHKSACFDVKNKNVSVIFYDLVDDRDRWEREKGHF